MNASLALQGPISLPGTQYRGSPPWAYWPILTATMNEVERTLPKGESCTLAVAVCI